MNFINTPRFMLIIENFNEGSRKDRDFRGAPGNRDP